MLPILVLSLPYLLPGYVVDPILPFLHPEYVVGAAGAAAVLLVGLYRALQRGKVRVGREAEFLEATIAAKDATIAELLKQNTSLIEQNRVTVDALNALRLVAERNTQ